MNIGKRTIIYFGILAGLIIWVIDAFLDTYVFFWGHSFLYWVFIATPHEFWVRILILVIFICFSYFVQNQVNIIHAANDELKRSKEKIDIAYKRAEFYKDIFTHDINNILQNVLTGIQLSETYIGNPEKLEKLKRYNNLIEDQIKRGKKLVSSIHKLSKLEEEEILIMNVEINSILEKSISYVKIAYPMKNITVQIDSIGKELFIRANELLEDLFENILINAVKYNENPTVEIIVKISKEEQEGINYFKIEFKDNGIGISDSRKNLIYQRGYSEKTSIQGMGIGLSLVKKIIENYKGKLWVEDKVKGDYTKGSNFIVLIPVVVQNVQKYTKKFKEIGLILN